MKKKWIDTKSYLSRYFVSLFSTILILSTYSCIDTNDYDTSLSGKMVSIKMELKGLIGSGEIDSNIFDLYMVAFPKNEGQSNIVKGFIYNNENVSLTGKSITFELAKGTYDIYFIANVSHNNELHSSNNYTSLSSKLNSVTSIDNLNEILIQYNNNLVSYPFLMTSKVELDTNNPTLSVCMNHTCVKVKYTISFDNRLDSTDRELVGKKFELKSIQFKHIANKSNLFISSIIDNQTFFDGPTYEFKLIDSNILDFNQPKWSYTDSIYIPECIYPEQRSGANSEYSYLEIVGGILGSTANSTFKIQLTGTENAKDSLITPRGTEYIIEGKIRSLGVLDGLEATIYHMPWTVEGSEVTLGNTVLWVSKTSTEITSLVSDSIKFQTNTKNVSIKISQPKLLTVESIDDLAGKKIRIKMNPNLDLSQLQEGENKGVTQLTIKVDNLVKIIDVAYDLRPILIVNPLSTVIDLNGGLNHTTINYLTNVGKIKFENLPPINGITEVKDLGNGKISITAGSHITTQEYTFDVVPENSRYSSYPELRSKVTVIAKPIIDGWRIYLKVINDKESNNIWQKAIGDDGWVAHNAYIYTQVGSVESSNNVWRFSGIWPGTNMQSDLVNQGWYYYDLKNIDVLNNEDFRKPKPAETLVMFNSVYASSSKHRYPYNLEPGIPLYDFTDREGWYVYDPTADFYEFYDDKPFIEEVEYRVYYKPLLKIDNVDMYWDRNYGQNFYLKAPSMPMQKEGGYFFNSIKLYALKENMTKAITIKFSTGETSMIYGGADFSISQTLAVGTYTEDGKWHKGNTGDYPSLRIPEAGKRRIYYYNSNNYNPVKIHFWPNGLAWDDRPNMTNWFGKWYYYDIPDNSDFVIFSSNNQQSGNIDVNKTSNEVYYNNGWKLRN